MAEPAYQVISFRPDQEAQSKNYKKRKTHRKSKAGCFGCKVKRVKCDENRPSCTRCLRNNVQCAYISDTKSLSKSLPANNSSLIARIYSQPSLTTLVESLSSTPSPISGTPRLALLNHLHHHFSTIQGLEAAGSNLTPVIKLGMTHPYLLDATLAIAASHLRYTQEQHLNANTPAIAACRVAECFQQSLAIRSFQTALQLPLLDQQASDALLITCMMLNLLTFTTVEPNQPMRCWVFSDEEDRLNWFSVNMGLKTLLLRTEAYRNESMLEDVFKASDDEQGTFHGSGYKPLVNVPEHWMRLCGLVEASSQMDDVFYEPIRILAIIRNLPVTEEALWLYMSFFGKLDFDFRNLLEANDERAIWILGYWLGLLCRFENIWWFRGRSCNDYHGICIWFDRQGVKNRHDQDGEMWKSLIGDLESAPFPPSYITAIDWDNLDI